MPPFISALVLNPWIAIILVALVGIYIIWRSHQQEFTKMGGKSMLSNFTRNLTQEAKDNQIEPVIGRVDEVARVVHILSRKSKNNPILLGPPGVGKTAIVEGLARLIASGEVPDNLKTKEVLALDLGGMISGTKYRGEFEERVKKLLEEILAAKQHYILFIDEVHMIVQAKGSEGALNVSDILKPALARGELQAIGATTLKEYEEFIKPDDALDRRFQPVPINEPKNVDALQIIRGIKSIYEKHHGVIITDEALKASVELSSKYITGRFLPDKAIDLIDEAGASVGIESAHETKHASAVLATAAVEKKRVGNTAKEYRKKIEEELNHVILLGKAMPAESELSDIAGKLEHLIKELRGLETEHGSVQPAVTALDIKKVVAAWTGKKISELK